MLLSFNVTVQNETIKFLGCYAPSSGDEPDFFVDCREILDNSTESHGLILGDLKRSQTGFFIPPLKCLKKQRGG